MNHTIGPITWTGPSKEGAYHLRGGLWRHRIGLAYSEADARLWAKAPELYALLVALGECKTGDEAHDLIVNQGADLLEEIEGKEAT